MLIALGLINWRYQSGEASAAQNSWVIIAVGAILVALLFLPATKRIFENRIIKIITWLLIAVAVIFAIIN
jgi:hypothetical protein